MESKDDGVVWNTYVKRQAMGPSGRLQVTTSWHLPVFFFFPPLPAHHEELHNHGVQLHNGPKPWS